MATSRQDDSPPRPVGHEQLDGVLDRPVQRFHLGTEIDHLHAQQAWHSGTGPSSTTLIKHPDLRVVLVAIRKGESLPVHRTVARITVQGLSGKLQLKVGDKLESVAAGELLMIDRDLPHDVEAVEDSAFLLTLAWPAGYVPDSARESAGRS